MKKPTCCVRFSLKSLLESTSNLVDEMLNREKVQASDSGSSKKCSTLNLKPSGITKQRSPSRHGSRSSRAPAAQRDYRELGIWLVLA